MSRIEDECVNGSTMLGMGLRSGSVQLPVADTSSLVDGTQTKFSLTAAHRFWTNLVTTDKHTASDTAVRVITRKQRHDKVEKLIVLQE